MDTRTIDCGMFGINIHKAGVFSEQVNGWSAGCQVFQKSDDFYEFMSLVQKSRKRFGNSFTYTLLKKSDL